MDEHDCESHRIVHRFTDRLGFPTRSPQCDKCGELLPHKLSDLMDPNEALRIAADPEYFMEDRIQALRDLGDWIDRGGFFPDHDPVALKSLSAVDWAEETQYSGEAISCFDTIAKLHNGLD